MPAWAIIAAVVIVAMCALFERAERVPTWRAWDDHPLDPYRDE